MIIVEIVSFFQMKAKVLSANNFNVILFDDVRPTPYSLFQSDILMLMVES